MYRADCSWICQAGGSALEIFNSKFSGTSLADYVFIACPESSKVHSVRSFNTGDKELSRAIFFSQVNCKAKTNLLVTCNCWLAINGCVGNIHIWHFAHCPNDCETNDVSKANFATTAASQVIVQHDSVINH